MVLQIKYQIILVMVQLLQAEIIKDHFEGPVPRQYPKGEKRLGTVVLYRTTGSNSHHESDIHNPHHYLLSTGKSTKNRLEEQRSSRMKYVPTEEYDNTLRSKYKISQQSKWKYLPKRITNNYQEGSSLRRQSYHPSTIFDNRNDYINRHNYKAFNSHEAVYESENHFRDRNLETRFHSGLPNDFQILTGNPYHQRHVLDLPPVSDVHTGLELPHVHKHMTRVHFSRGDSYNVFPNVFESNQFSHDNRRPTVEHHYHYKGVPVYQTHIFAEKEYDPQFIALYRTVVEAYQNKQSHVSQDNKSKNNRHPVSEVLYPQLPRNEKTIFKKLLDVKKPTFVISQYSQLSLPPEDGFTFPNFIRSNFNPDAIHQTAPFRPSPPFYRYSEPDPLYHPDHTPLKMQTTSTTEVPTSTEKTTKKIEVPNTGPSKLNYPDSINAQLPPPTDGEDTRIPYVSATIVTLHTSNHDSTTPVAVLQMIKQNASILQTQSSISVADANTSEANTSVTPLNSTNSLALSFNKTILNHEELLKMTETLERTSKTVTKNSKLMQANSTTVTPSFEPMSEISRDMDVSPHRSTELFSISFVPTIASETLMSATTDINRNQATPNEISAPFPYMNVGSVPSTMNKQHEDSSYLSMGTSEALSNDESSKFTLENQPINSLTEMQGESHERNNSMIIQGSDKHTFDIPDISSNIYMEQVPVYTAAEIEESTTAEPSDEPPTVTEVSQTYKELLLIMGDKTTSEEKKVSIDTEHKNNSNILTRTETINKTDVSMPNSANEEENLTTEVMNLPTSATESDTANYYIMSLINEVHNHELLVNTSTSPTVLNEK